MPNAKEIYRQSISLLPLEEKLQLAALILNDLAAPDGQSRERVSVVEMISSLRQVVASAPRQRRTSI